MNKVRLGDVCISITDGEHGSPNNDPKGTCWFLNNNNLTSSGIVINPNDRRISEKTFQQIRRRTHLAQGDVLIATCGTLGKTCIVRENPSNLEFSRSVGIIKPDRDKLNERYLHYFFTLPSTQKRIQKIATGGVQKHFYIADMEDFLIYLPSMSTQKAIASLLGTIDDKIALNKKLCAELEETAQLIYDYWFTQFDFPDENGNPYRSSGGKIVYNETLKREIPEGWKEGALSDLAAITMGQSPVGSTYNRMGLGVPFFQGRADFTELFPAEITYTTAPTRMAAEDDILLSVRAPIGDLNLSITRCCIGRGLAAIRDKHESPLFIYCTLNNHAARLSRAHEDGTTFGAVDKEGLSELACAIPPTSLLDSFRNSVSGIYSQLKDLEQQNRHLTALRDWLLPMLMNGQVKPGNTPEDVTEVHV